MTDTEIQWEGHKILINTRLMPKYLWLAAETVIKVDDIEVTRAGGFGLTDKLKATIIHNNYPRELLLEVKSDVFSIGDVPYKFFVDGGLISVGRLTINNNWLQPFIVEQPKKKRKYGYRLGSCSLLIGILVLISAITGILLLLRIDSMTSGDFSRASSASIFLPMLFLMEAGVLSLLGLFFGIFGLFQKNRNLFHAIMGILFSAIVLAFFVLVVNNMIHR